MKPSKPEDFRNWIGVDFDGTLAHYEGFKGDEVVGKPVPAMVKRVRGWLDEGYEVRIFTARPPHPAIKRWCKEQFGQILPITNRKDPGMIAMYDDRAVSVERNTGRVFSADSVKQVEL